MINGVVAVPVMAMMMLMSRRPDVMGRFTIRGSLLWLGWIATLAMGAAVAAMAILSI